MSETAYKTQYRDEFIAGFEKRQALSRHTCVTEADVDGNSAVFLVADSGGASAVTRGVNGDIPTRGDNNTQNTCTLEEWHDVVEKTNFNVMSSQGNQRALMQQTTMSVINRKIDEQIRTELATATVTWGAAAAATLTLVTKAKTILANNFALRDAPIYALITPAFHGYLMGLNQFTSADYIADKKFEGVSMDQAFSWYGVNWIVDADLAGAGTASATCFMFSQNAIGHAAHMDGVETDIGYDGKNAKSWCRATVHMNAKLLQNSGVIKMLHDDSALSA